MSCDISALISVYYRQASWLVRQFGKLTNEISVRDYDDYYKRKFTTHKRTSVSRLVIKITQDSKLITITYISITYSKCQM